MVITMIAVLMMKVAIDQIVDVIAVRHAVVTAAGPVQVPGAMIVTSVLRGASVRIGGARLNPVLVDVITVHVVQVAVVQIVDVPRVTNLRMAAAVAVLMRVPSMHVAAHDVPLSVIDVTAAAPVRGPSGAPRHLLQ
jgi:hypothetical protein